MAYRQYKNLVQTSLNGAINNSTTSVVLTSATGWPTTGDFDFIIDNELFKGTSISGTTVTVATRGQAGTSDATTAASHSDGATVTLVLTAGGLLALPARFNGSGLDSAKPSAGTAGGETGALWFSTDLNVLYRSDNSTWSAVDGNPPRCRIYHNANQNLSDGALTLFSFNSERYDTDNQHYTSSANLTGTSAANNSTTMTGTSTLFLTELSVGQMINFNAGQIQVVTAIASDTSLTVNTAFTGGSLSGKTVARVNTSIVIRTPGTYRFTFNGEWDVGSTASYRLLEMYINASTLIGGDQRPGIAVGIFMASFSAEYQMSQWDYVSVYGLQQSGGTRTMNSTANSSPEFQACWLGYP